jgi:hypothetical protein
MEQRICRSNDAWIEGGKGQEKINLSQLCLSGFLACGFILDMYCITARSNPKRLYPYYARFITLYCRPTLKDITQRL